jgi:hypothetical protein
MGCIRHETSRLLARWWFALAPLKTKPTWIRIDLALIDPSPELVQTLYFSENKSLLLNMFSKFLKCGLEHIYLVKVKA